MYWGKPQELQNKQQLRSQGLKNRSRTLLLSPRSLCLQSAKDTKQIVQVTLKLLGFKLIIRYLQKEMKIWSKQNKNDMKIKAQVSKDKKNSMKCKC